MTCALERCGAEWCWLCGVRLEAQGANISVKPAGGFTLVSFLLNSLPILLLIGVWIFFMRQMQVGGGKAMSFGKARAKGLSASAKRITFGPMLAPTGDYAADFAILVALYRRLGVARHPQRLSKPLRP